MSYECELKYLLPEKYRPADVFSHPAISPYLTGEIQTIAMHSTYFDTQDHALEKRRAALRLRLENGAPIVTLKTMISTEGALSKRGEWEVSARSVSDALPQLAQAGAPPEILAMLAEDALCITAQFSFVRECAHLHSPDFSAHLCVDIGFLSPDGTQKTPLREVELELADGDADALAAKGNALRAALEMRCEPRSKLCRARGY